MLRLLSLVLLSLAALSGCPRTNGGAPGVNTAVDTDGDGEPDRALVADWDGDGQLTLRDVQAAIDALTDPGPKLVELVPGQVFTSDGITSVGNNSHGLVELPGFTTLDCFGSTLEGVDDQAYGQGQGSWPQPLVTLTNTGHDAQDTDEVHIRDCVVSGGMPPGFSSAPWPARIYMGVALIGVRDSSIRGSRVSDTLHACIYVKNAHDILIEDNDLERCGGASEEPSLYQQPAIYLFQTGSHTTERIVVRGNRVVHAGNALFNTRVGSANAEYQTAWMRDIVFESNTGEDDDGDACFGLRGAREVLIRGNVCTATSGILLGAGSQQYCSDNPATAAAPVSEASCVADVRVEDNLLVENVANNSNGVIQVYAHLDGLVLQDNAVMGFDGPVSKHGLRVALPVRHFEVADLTLQGCAGSCVRVEGEAQTNAPAGEELAFRGLRIDGSGLRDPFGEHHACVQILSRLEGATLEDWDLGGCTGQALWATDLAETELRDFRMDRLVPGHLGSIDLSTEPLPTCSLEREEGWLAVHSSDGGCGGGAGSSAVRCFCRQGDWNVFEPTLKPGIELGRSEDLWVLDGVVQNVDGHIAIYYSPGGNHHGGVSGLRIAQPELGQAVFSPMVRGVYDASAGGGVGVSDVVCEPGAVSGACVQL